MILDPHSEGSDFESLSDLCADFSADWKMITPVKDKTSGFKLRSPFLAIFLGGYKIHLMLNPISEWNLSPCQGQQRPKSLT